MAGRYIRPSYQYLDNSGRILDSGQLFFYDSGTTTLKDVYSDPDGLVPIANPVVLDGAGRTPDVYLDGSYKLIIQDKNNVQIEERDPVLAADDTTKGFGPWNAVTIYSVDDIVRGSDNLLYISITGSNQNNDPTSSAVNWTEVQFLNSYNANESYSIGDVVIDASGNIFRSLTNSNIGNTPSSSPSDWSNTVAGAFAGNVTVGGTLGVTGITTLAAVNATTGTFTGDIILPLNGKLFLDSVLDTYVEQPIDGIIRFVNNSVESFRTEAAGSVAKFAGKIDASVGGINLGGTAAANLLTDYETGIHVGTVVPETSGTVTLNGTSDSLAYVKVGQIVHIHGALVIASVASPVGTYVDVSLPFVIANLAEVAERFGNSVSFLDASTSGWSTLPIQGLSGSVFRVILDASTLAISDTFYFSFSYSTSA